MLGIAIINHLELDQHLKNIMNMKNKTKYIDLILLTLVILGAFLVNINLISRIVILFPSIMIACYFFPMKLFKNETSKMFILSDILVCFLITIIIITFYIPQNDTIKFLRIIIYLISIGFFIYFKNDNKQKMYLHALIFTLPFVVPMI